MKIGIVNDGLLIAEALRRIIINTQEHQVVWVARDGEQAVRFCAENRPDLILMDLIMPVMDGVEATRLIMQNTPCAILIVTASPEDNTNLVFRALGAGALDVTATPVMAGNAASDSALLAKIKTIGKLIAADNASGAAYSPLGEADIAGSKVDMLVAIGSSTGGPMALAKILKGWVPPTNAGVVIVQHIDQAFTDSFANWLGTQIGYDVGVIEQGAPLAPGKIVVAKTNDHLVFDDDLHLSYSADPVSYPYRPSIDVFFQCIARHWKKKAIGVLLTGMGRDGAKGLLAMRQAGYLTLAQDRATSAVYGMPKAAAELGAAEQILPLERIGSILRSRSVV